MPGSERFMNGLTFEEWLKEQGRDPVLWYLDQAAEAIKTAERFVLRASEVADADVVFYPQTTLARLEQVRWEITGAFHAIP